MKFIVSTQNLLKELSILSGVIGTNSVLPILEDFLMDLTGNELKISASDLETSISSVVQVDGDEDGIIAIPAKILLDTLKALPDQPLSFDINVETFTVAIGSATGAYNLIGESGEDFPTIPTRDGVNEVNIDSKILHNAITKTLFATSTEELRPAMTGINVELSEDGATFVATDAHKLVKYKNKAIKSAEYTNFIVPRKAMGLLKNALVQQAGDVNISYNSTNAFFNIGGIDLICRLIDAKYPDYNAVIPINNPSTLTINRSDLEKALKRIAIYSSKTTNSVKLSIKSDHLKLYAEDRDFSNEAQEQLNCEFIGEPLDIAFNARFLAEVLNVLDSEQVVVKLSTPNRAGVVVPTETEEDEDLLMLVMPLMINQQYG